MFHNMSYANQAMVFGRRAHQCPPAITLHGRGLCVARMTAAALAAILGASPPSSLEACA